MKGFEIGSTVESCTKGIWMWNQPIIDSNEVDENITILIDTEGLHSSERTTDVDLKIFALTILLCSSFVYNQMGPINEQALTDLHLIVNLVKYFGNLSDIKSDNQQIPQQNGADELGKFTGPDFFWCLRDFYHDISEQFQTPNEYMEDCLKPALGSVSAETLKKNNIRKIISTFFKVRQCHTLVRPVDDEDQLANIEDLQWNSPQIKEEFRE